jgi:N-methylhydantoinase B
MPDPIRLEIYKNLFAAIAEEMGVVLRKASYSPNIKERRDYSCAVFDPQGRMVAQAAHIPVHLGSMPLSVAAAVQAFGDLEPGDMVILNDPFRGGTHLPDITLVSPVFTQPRELAGDGLAAQRLVGFVANRAHHADVGGMTPGSMPIGREIYQEGLIIPPVRLVKGGVVDQGLLALILANVRTPEERYGDLWAQMAANRRGVERLAELVARNGQEEVLLYMGELLIYTERMTSALISELPDGEYAFTDYLDDDGVGDQPVRIAVQVTITGDQAVVDFSNSAPQQKGSVNAVFAITLSAVYYVFRCLLGQDVPNNSGCLAPVQVIAPPGCVLNAMAPAAVAGGNVETSQRIVDVLLGALALTGVRREKGASRPQDFPLVAPVAAFSLGSVLNPGIPAASQGTMNNVIIGGYDARYGRPFTYYETIGGGMGARPEADGPSAVHSHMTNTLNTPAEALEYAYPLRVRRYAVRIGSGGAGRQRGGDGICREIEVLVEAQATLLSERRRLPPYGLDGGAPGALGENILIRGDQEIHLPGKGTFELQPGDILSIRTPGGGGYGAI